MKDWFKLCLPKQQSYALNHLHIIRTGKSVPASHNALPDAQAMMTIMVSLKAMTYELAAANSESWEVLQARCRR